MCLSGEDKNAYWGVETVHIEKLLMLYTTSRHTVRSVQRILHKSEQAKLTSYLAVPEQQKNKYTTWLFSNGCIAWTALASRWRQVTRVEHALLEASCGCVQ